MRVDAVASSTSSRASSTSRWSPSSRRCTTWRCRRWWQRGGIGAFCSMGNGLIQDRMEEHRRRGEPAGLHRRVGRLERRAGAAGARLAGRLHGRRARRRRSPRARELAAALEPSGRTRVTDNVRGMIWSKLLINSTFTGPLRGLRAALRRRRRAGPRRRLLPLGARASRSATRRGSSWSRSTTSIRTTSTTPAWRHMMEHMANVRPSMLQDLDAGRETEVDVVNGGVAAQGARARRADAVQRRAWSSSCTRSSAASASSEPRWLGYVSDAQTISATES